MIAVRMFILCLVHLPYYSLSLSFSLQDISLFYKFTTYSNDSEVFSGIEIDDVDLDGVFTTTGMFSHPSASSHISYYSPFGIPSLNPLTLVVSPYPNWLGIGMVYVIHV